MTMPNKRNRPYRFSHLSLIGVLALSTVITGCSQSDDEKDREQAALNQQNNNQIQQARQAQAQSTNHSYQVMTAQTSSSQATVALGGSVVPQTELTIRAQAPGRVVYIAGDEGTKVRAGDTIVDLDEKSLVARRRAAMAGLQRARAQLNNAFIQLDQNIISEGHSSRGGMGLPSMFDQFVTKNIGDSMGVGDSDYDRYASISASRASVEQAKSMVLEAESNIDQIDAMFRDKQAIAPEDATILDKMIELGDAVQPGQALLRIGDTSILQVIVDVPTRLMTGIKEGLVLPVSLDTTGDTLDAEIIRVFPSADVKRNTVRVKLALPENNNATPGMYATVLVPDSARGNLPTITVPNSAIMWRGSQASVFVVNTSGRAELRMIRAGTNTEEQTSILSGVSEGDRIVTTPDTHLRSGMMIQTINSSTQSYLTPKSVFTTPKV